MYLANKQGKSNKTGAIGEAMAQRFMENKGFLLLQQNYSQKWGEIDLIFQKGATIHFVEVKSVSHETRALLEQSAKHGHRPEEQVTKAKYKKLSRTIDTWLQQENYKGQYQLDLVTVRLVPRETYAQVEYFGNIVVE